jgi:trans-aconitate methyltransferase
VFDNNTDRDWEKFGKDDAYFGVIAHPKYRKSNLTEEGKKEFFQSGADDIDRVLSTVRRQIDQDFTIKKAIDFGCGVGRVLIPLASVSEEVIGIDVSDSMLDEAKENCKAQSIENVAFIKSDDTLSRLKNKYNFIHSLIVFQHIPVTRGMQIFENLLTHLDVGGVCVVHFTYATYNKERKFLSFIKKYIPFSRNFINLTLKRDFFAPQMQMNKYNLNQLLLLLQKADIHNYYAEFTNHGGELGMVFYFQKNEAA